MLDSKFAVAPPRRYAISVAWAAASVACVTLSLTHDLAEIYADNAALRNQLLLLMLVFTGLLSAVLFLLLKRQDETAMLRSAHQTSAGRDGVA